MRTPFLISLVALTVAGAAAFGEPPAGSSPPAPVAPPPPPVQFVGEELVTPAPAENPDDGRFWLDADYLLWWMKKSPVPAPLVAAPVETAPATLTPLPTVGTTTGLGNSSVSTGTRSGGRLGVGGWIDDGHTLGAEADYFFLAGRTVSQGVFSSGQPGSPILAVPFFDADAAAPSSFLLGAPGDLAGGATLTIANRLEGAEANCVVGVLEGPRGRFEVLGGFRYLEFREALTFATTSTGIQPAGAGSNNGLVLNTLDQFATDNRFFGFQAGARGEYRLGDLFVGGSVKLAVGDMDETTDIHGATVTNFFKAPAGGPFAGVPTQVVPNSGTFAQPSNVGRASQHQMVFIPDVGVRAGYQFAPWARAYVGYELLYVGSVARPGAQMDTQFNVAQTVQGAVAGVPAASGTRPAVILTGSGFWAQGLEFGVEVSY